MNSSKGHLSEEVLREHSTTYAKQPMASNSNSLLMVSSLGRKVIGTLFSYQKGYLSFTYQVDPTSVPMLIIKCVVSTSMLVKKMPSTLVRIALECKKNPTAISWRQMSIACEVVQQANVDNVS
ncbi:Hypothetical predicted protein [Olea europaea subsp. europaea]|uniref:Uncharacterized protein n=1 Tax=Olea europaea subsp. europaea TaxID=158383 RepID=A0A8S0UTT2_OLEEU|nr:Hypothetical predicted protein [Olea europaea subsp. europaea]